MTDRKAEGRVTKFQKREKTENLPTRPVDLSAKKPDASSPIDRYAKDKMMNLRTIIVVWGYLDICSVDRNAILTLIGVEGWPTNVANGLL